MEWIIVFVVSWLLFFLLVDWGELKINFWCGIISAILQLAIDAQAFKHSWYQINRGVLRVFGSSIFFVMGPVLVIGILMAQFHPIKRWMRVINIIVLSFLYSVFEFLALARKVLVYIDWHYTESLVINTCAMIVLSWFTIVILDK